MSAPNDTHRPLRVLRDDAPIDRRAFLEGAGRAALGTMIVAAVGCELSELRDTTPAPAEVAFDVNVAPYNALANAPSALAINAGPLRLLFIRVSQAEVVCLDRLCTHQACDLDPAGRQGVLDVARQRILCKCHNAEFDFRGAVLAGPARLPLQSYAVTFDPGTGRGKVRFS